MSRLEELSDQITSHPQVKNAQAWYQALSARDRLVVKWVAALFSGVMVFVLIYAPLIQNNQRLSQALDKKIAVYDLIAENAGRFGRVSTSNTGRTDGPALPRITKSARRAGIKLDRYEQDGKGVRIWLDKVKFDQFITWSEELGNRYSIRVSQVSIDRDNDTGWVDVRATLMPD